MEKALIVKVQKEYAIVATPDSRFIKIRLRQGMAVGQKIYFFEDDVVTDPVASSPSRSIFRDRRLLTAMAAVLVFMAIFVTSLMGPGGSIYAVVSVDINPSFQLTLDKQMNVIGITATNADSQALVDQGLVGQSLTKAMSDIFSDVEASGVKIEDKSSVLISTVSPDFSETNEVKAKVLRGVQQALKENTAYQKTQIVILEADSEDLNEAENADLSVGKYKLYELNQDKLKVEDVIQKKVSEIMEDPEVLLNIADDPEADIYNAEFLQTLAEEYFQRMEAEREDIEAEREELERYRDQLEKEWEELEKQRDELERHFEEQEKLFEEKEAEAEGLEEFEADEDDFAEAFMEDALVGVTTTQDLKGINLRELVGDDPDHLIGLIEILLEVGVIDNNFVDSFLESRNFDGEISSELLQDFMNHLDQHIQSLPDASLDIDSGVEGVEDDFEEEDVDDDEIDFEDHEEEEDPDDDLEENEEEDIDLEVDEEETDLEFEEDEADSLEETEDTHNTEADMEAPESDEEESEKPDQEESELDDQEKKDTDSPSDGENKNDEDAEDDKEAVIEEPDSEDEPDDDD